jgi:hypothetical protein
VAMVYNAVWARTPCSLVHGYECLEVHSGSVFTGRQDGGSMC